VRPRPGLLLLALLASAGCLGDAPHSNPLDPDSANFADEAAVAGAVVRASRPAEGVPGATVQLVPAEGGAVIVAAVSGSGAFAVEDVRSGTYTLTAEAPGYAPADTTVTVSATEPPPDMVLLLNALPSVVDQAVHTERINRFFPPPEEFSRLVVEATVADPDGLGDLIAVDFIIPDFDFRAPLQAVTGEEGKFTRTFDEAELPVGLQDLLGRNLFIEVADREGATVRSADTHVTRIVESIPVAISPQYNPDAPITPPFEMTWEPLELPYTFTWRVEVFFVPLPGESIPILLIEDIPSAQTSQTITAEMAAGWQAGNYQWFVSAVDVFGNLARSKEAGFQLDPD
jgi:hypothetical protein